jgi:hypothetical protein
MSQGHAMKILISAENITKNQAICLFFLVFCKLYSHVDKIMQNKCKNPDVVELAEKIKDLVAFNRWTPVLYAFKQDMLQESNIKLHL